MERLVRIVVPWVAIALAVASFWVRPAPPGPGAPPRAAVGYPAPAFELRTLQGETVRLADLRGRPVMLNFWATWCGPCRVEMPEVDRLARSVGRGEAGPVVLAVNWTASERSTGEVERFIREGGFAMPVPLDVAGEVAAAYQVRALPTTYFIDPRGVVAARFAGPMNGATMATALESAARQAGRVDAAASRTAFPRLPLLAPVLPPALSIGGLTLPSSAAAVMVAALLLLWTAERSGAAASDLVTWALIGGFTGSRLPDLLADPAAAIVNPLGALLSRGPRAVWGAAAGVVSASAWLAARRRLQPETVDRLAAPTLASVALAALGWDDPRALPATVLFGLAAAALWRFEVGAAQTGSSTRRTAGVRAILAAALAGVALLAAELFAPQAGDPGLTATQFAGLALALAGAAASRRAGRASTAR